MKVNTFVTGVWPQEPACAGEGIINFLSNDDTPLLCGRVRHSGEFFHKQQNHQGRTLLLRLILLLFSPKGKYSID
jgi:hypothetical protein